jgi:DNA-binding NarL/FixJ family response regulator
VRTSFNGSQAISCERDPAALGPAIPQYGTAAAAEVRSSTKGPPIVVALIERRVLVRDYVARALELTTGLTVIPQATVEEWVRASADTPASAVLLSASGGLTDPETKSALAALSELRPKLPIVVLSDVEDAREIVHALGAGVRGWIPTSVSLDVACQAIRLVSVGGTFVPAGSLLSVERSDTAAGEQAPLNSIFTARQLAVVEALRRGKANKIIAYELNMRESTVKVHVRNIMKRLNAKNRTEVAFRFHELLKSGVMSYCKPAGCCD